MAVREGGHGYSLACPWLLPTGRQSFCLRHGGGKNGSLACLWIPQMQSRSPPPYPYRGGAATRRARRSLAVSLSSGLRPWSPSARQCVTGRSLGRRRARRRERWVLWLEGRRLPKGCGSDLLRRASRHHVESRQP